MHAPPLAPAKQFGGSGMIATVVQQLPAPLKGLPKA
jgi:hypothetical protein